MQLVLTTIPKRGALPYRVYMPGIFSAYSLTPYPTHMADVVDCYGILLLQSPAFDQNQRLKHVMLCPMFPSGYEEGQRQEHER